MTPDRSSDRNPGRSPDRRRDRGPVFVARRTYRRRRLADAARMLPIAAGVLMILPLLWQGPAGDPGTAPVMLYIFALWGLLVVIAALLARHLRSSKPDTDPTDATDATDPAGDI